MLTLKQADCCAFLTPAQVQAIILSLLSSNQPKLALDVVEIVSLCSRVDPGLVISVYLSNG